jgi:hypothetical protein
MKKLKLHIVIIEITEVLSLLIFAARFIESEWQSALPVADQGSSTPKSRK